MYTFKNDTEKAVFEMLTESTGTHFLDSGMGSNRHWQRNQKKTLEDFRNQPYIKQDSVYPEEITKSLFHHLNESLIYNEELTLNYKQHLEDSNRMDNMEVVYSLIKYQYKTDSKWVNTYNYDSVLSQVIQFAYIGNDFYDSDFIVLSIHNGADVRGGYTDYKVFDVEFDSLLNDSPEYWQESFKEEENEELTLIKSN